MEAFGSSCFTLVHFGSKFLESFPIPKAQNVDYAQQLNHFRSQAAELEVKAKMQA